MKQSIWLWFLATLCICLSQNALAASADQFSSNPAPLMGSSSNIEFLPVDEAFQLKVVMLEPDRVQVEWINADTYYLYKHGFSFKADDNITLVEPVFPAGIKKEDEFFGAVEVFYHNIQLTIPFSGSADPFMLSISYQGCADAGLCYPPQTRKFNINPSTMAVNQAIKAVSRKSVEPAMMPERKRISMPATSEGSLAAVIADESLLVTMALFFLAGIGLAFTPCVLPMVPILSSIIVGQKEIPSRAKAFGLSLTYVLGMAITYAILGMLVGFFGAEFNIQAKLQSPWVLSSFAVLFVLLALSMFGFYELQLPQRLRDRLSDMNQQQQGGQYAGVALMGVLSSLVVSPCVSAPLAGALIYISATGDAVIGGVALLALGLGMGTPLIIIGSSGGHLLPKAGAWMNAVKSVFGVMLLAVAIWMLERIIPASLTLGLWAVLAIVCAIYLGAMDSTPRRGWMQLWKGFGIVSLIYGIFLLIGAFSGAQDPLRPLSNLNSTPAIETSHTSFRPVTDLQSLNRILASSNQPVMFDFYADWCISCKVMEREVFNNPSIQEQLSNFLVLQIDVTANSLAHQEVLDAFNLFGPPSILFFDRQGKELEEFRIQGEMSLEAFANHLSAIQRSIAEAP
jgi:thiol:disulfide interchange protein DsbD